MPRAGAGGSIREGQGEGKLFQVEERTGRVLCRKLGVNLSHFKKTCRAPPIAESFICVNFTTSQIPPPPPANGIMMDSIQIVVPLTSEDRNIELSMSESDVLSIFIPSFSTTGECRVQFGFYNSPVLHLEQREGVRLSVFCPLALSVSACTICRRKISDINCEYLF